MTNNIFDNIPDKIPNELFETILTTKNIKIEKIVSYGHISPLNGWYNQEENEWVIIMEGEAKIEFEKEIIHLRKGDYLNIPARKKHKVIWTTTSKKTVWLAIFY